MDALAKENEALRLALDIENDEYVQQVGYWKIQQREKEEIASLRESLKGGIVSDDKKPREFWLVEGATRIIACSADPRKIPMNESANVLCHVIEHSAYAALQKENELLKLDRDNAMAQFFNLQNKASEGIIALEEELASLREELEGYKIGASVEAKAGDEARAQLQIAIDAIKDVIRSSHDIIAKKRCSEALREIEGKLIDETN
jgi:hypothetical protein